jgi:hypothetical protein
MSAAGEADLARILPLVECAPKGTAPHDCGETDACCSASPTRCKEADG